MNGNVLANDTGVDGGLEVLQITHTSSASQVSAGISINGDYGVLTINKNGIFDSQANVSIPVGVNQADIFEYSMQDRNGSTDTAALIFNIDDNAAEVLVNTINPPNNAILTTNFGNDIIYGDVKTFSLDLTEGSVTSTGISEALARAYIENTAFNFNDDNINHEGGADQIYGDIYELKYLLMNGTGTGMTDASIKNVTINSGDDTIDAARGTNASDDTIAGDALVFSGTVNGVASSSSLDALSDFRALGNTVNWGNDTITTRAGNDEVIFALDEIFGINNRMAMQGVDVITDLDLANDKLVFGNVLDLDSSGGASDAADLDLTTVFLDINYGALAIIFHGAGSTSGIVNDNTITNAANRADLVAAIGGNGDTEGAVVLEGLSTATVPDFAFLESNLNLTVHPDMLFL